MASDREIQLTISANDQASAELRRIAAEAKASGLNMAQSMDEAGRSTSRLTEFIREERRENKMQNFLFREGKEAIGAAALALSAFGIASAGATGETKQLIHSLDQGMMTFQGFSFALAAAGAGGPWAMAAAAIAGVGAAIYQFSQESDKGAESLSKLNVEIAVLKEELGTGTEKDTLKAYQEQLKAAWENQDKLNQTTWSFRGMIKSLFTRGDVHGAVVKTVGTPEELKQAEKGVLDAEAALRKFGDTHKEMTRDRNVKGLEAAGLDTYKEYLRQFYFQDIKDMGKKTLREMEKLTFAAADITTTYWDMTFAALEEGSYAVVSGISEGFRQMFGEANSLFEKFVLGVMDAFARMISDLAVKAAIAGILDLVTGGALSFGAVFGKMTGGLFSTSGPVGGSQAVGGSEQSNRGPIGSSAISNIADAIAGLASAPVYGVVNIDGGQIMLQREMPGYSRWNSRKTV